MSNEPRRAADWYELLFDLVFVAVVAVAAERIEADPGLPTVTTTLLLFFPLWWAWVNLMATNNLYGEHVPAMGVLIIAAMPGPAAMAIAIAAGIVDFGWLYAVGAAWIRLILLAMWLLPRARTAGVWIVSIAVPPPFRYVLWVIAVDAEVALLAARGGFASEVYRRVSISHFLERIGLFVVIVVGEAVYLAVTGLAEHPTVPGASAGLAGLVICALLARAFFRWGAPSAEQGLTTVRATESFGALRDVAMYLPFLLIAGLTLIAAAIGVAVHDPDASLGLAPRLLLACGIGAFYLSNALIGVRLGRPLSFIVALLVPALILPSAASLLSLGSPGWVTLALAAAALVLLDLLTAALARRARRTNGSATRSPLDSL
jgi:low temperature requirement protein LtrA